jgi:hypothetical protein
VPRVSHKSEKSSTPVWMSHLGDVRHESGSVWRLSAVTRNQDGYSGFCNIMLRHHSDPPARICLRWRWGVRNPSSQKLAHLTPQQERWKPLRTLPIHAAMLHIFANSTAADTRNRRLVRHSMINHDFGFPKGADGQRQGSPFAHLCWVRSN